MVVDIRDSCRIVQAKFHHYVGLKLQEWLYGKKSRLEFQDVYVKKALSVWPTSVGWKIATNGPQPILEASEVIVISDEGGRIGLPFTWWIFWIHQCSLFRAGLELFSDAPKHTWPKKTNGRYYPSSKDLRNHISRAIATNNQESLLRKITDLKQSSPSTRFFLRTQEGEPNCFGDTVPSNESDNFLFVHQEEWQRKLLLKYGSDLALLDATYKTTKYAMPLFFWCVNTNVGYKVVAEFMCQHEDEISISEALGILRRWNQDWSPKYFMVDFSAAEIGAIETCFPGVVAYICDFHRQQAIQRWARAAKNGLDQYEREFLQSAMTRIGRAPTETQYNDELSKLRQSTLYKTKENVRDYVEKTWIPCHFRWCHELNMLWWLKNWRLVVVGWRLDVAPGGRLVVAVA